MTRANSWRLAAAVLAAAALGGATPAAEPAGPSVPEGGAVVAWNHPVALKLSVSDFGKVPYPVLKPVELFGARGGVYSGQVAVRSGKAITGLKAAVSALKADKEGGTIPAAAIQLRYPMLDGVGHYWREPTFDGLELTPPEEVAPHPKGEFLAVQPVWFTVRVPRDAKPGTYTGTLRITLPGAGDVVAPVQLKVHDWTVPEPKDFVMEPGYTQSPESVALQYKVPLWSEEHFKLLDKSLKLLGEVGTKAIYLTAIAKTNFGNEHAMIRWVKQPDGSTKPDFTNAEKYLDLAVKNMGQVPVVVFYAWDIDLGSTMFYAKEQVGEDKIKGARISVFDPASKELSYLDAPKPGTPESAAFWKPAFDGLKAVLAKRGLEKSLAVGVAGDMRPNKAIVTDFKTVAPDVPWAVCSHGFATNLWGQPTVYIASVWGSGRPGDPAKKRLYGWQERKVLITTFGRSGCGGIGKLSPGFALAQHRLALEGCMAGGIRGYMRMGADFWPCAKDDRGRPRALVDWYINWGGLAMSDSNTLATLAPGKDGPVATARYEMFREGTQECEARMFIEQALLDPARRGRLGEEQSRKCQELLDERTVTLVTQVSEGKCTEPVAEELARKVIPERSDWLYAAAAEVARALR